MDCLDAQRLISDALDRVSVPADELAEAKTHCRSCEDCASFVRALLATQRTELPLPPDGLADRVMARVRAEQARQLAERAAGRVAPGPGADLPAPGAEPTQGSDTSAPAPASTWRELLDRALQPHHRRALVAWSAAAAAVFVLAAFGAVTGVRSILVPPPASELDLSSSAMKDTGQERGAAPAPGPGGSAEQGAPTVSTAPDLITAGATVYRLVGPAPEIDIGDLTELATAETALTGQEPAEQYEVFGDPQDLGRVYLDDGEQVLAFQRVTRTYGGSLYVLQSGPIERFGEWPTLPAGISAPTEDDGSPFFEQDGADDNGTAVFTKVGGDASEGIAIAPNPPFPDPLAGAPDWTWWAPSER